MPYVKKFCLTIPRVTFIFQKVELATFVLLCAPYVVVQVYVNVLMMKKIIIIIVIIICIPYFNIPFEVIQCSRLLVLPY
jgi:hypothetical protein